MERLFDLLEARVGLQLALADERGEVGRDVRDLLARGEPAEARALAARIMAREGEAA